jgi:hypothetical protein
MTNHIDLSLLAPIPGVTLDPLTLFPHPFLIAVRDKLRRATMGQVRESATLPIIVVPCSHRSIGDDRYATLQTLLRKASMSITHAEELNNGFHIGVPGIKPNAESLRKYVRSRLPATKTPLMHPAEFYVATLALEARKRLLDTALLGGATIRMLACTVRSEMRKLHRETTVNALSSQLLRNLSNALETAYNDLPETGALPGTLHIPFHPNNPSTDDIVRTAAAITALPDALIDPDRWVRDWLYELLPHAGLNADEWRTKSVLFAA